MGDLHVQVRLLGQLVDDQVVRVRSTVVIGDWPNAVVAFPDASIQVSRAGDRLRALGRSLCENDTVHIELGDVHVTLTHTEPKRNLPIKTRGFDRPFLSTAIATVLVGAWIDSAETWLQRTPFFHEMTATHSRALSRSSEGPAADLASTSMPTQGTSRTLAGDRQTIGDGPWHRNDDHVTRVDFLGWFQRLVPHDQRTIEANEVLQADPSNMEARRLLARHAYHVGEFDLAAWHYSKLVEQAKSDISAKIRLAWAWRRQGHHARELALYQEVLSIHPGHLAALAGATSALGRLGRLGEASDTLDALQILAPTSPLTESATAFMHAIQGREQQAVYALQRALQAQEQLDKELGIEFRHDLALDPVFASLRRTTGLRSMLRRELGAAAPRTYRR